jgi:PatG Domain
MEPTTEQQVTNMHLASVAAPEPQTESAGLGTQVSPSANSCPTCGVVPASGLQPSWPPVYAIGRIVPRYPSPSIEKEMAQAAGRSDTAGLTDPQVLHTVLSRPENRYLARQLCWVLTIEGLDTYILQPRDPADFSQLVESLRPNPSPVDLDVVIGSLGPVASPQLCNGLLVPIVVFDQIYSFDRETLIKAIPKPNKISAKDFVPMAAELLDRIMQMANNAGATADHRALNYLAVRYGAIYTAVGEAFNRNASLTSVEVRPSPLGGVRNVVDVIFAFTNRATDVIEKAMVRVDVTELFPFLVRKLSPYFDR